MPTARTLIQHTLWAMMLLLAGIMILGTSIGIYQGGEFMHRVSMVMAWSFGICALSHTLVTPPSRRLP